MSEGADLCNATPFNEARITVCHESVPINLTTPSLPLRLIFKAPLTALFNTMFFELGDLSSSVWLLLGHVHSKIWERLKRGSQATSSSEAMTEQFSSCWNYQCGDLETAVVCRQYLLRHKRVFPEAYHFPNYHVHLSFCAGEIALCFWAAKHYLGRDLVYSYWNREFPKRSPSTLSEPRTVQEKSLPKIPSLLVPRMLPNKFSHSNISLKTWKGKSKSLY